MEEDAYLPNGTQEHGLPAGGLGETLVVEPQAVDLVVEPPVDPVAEPPADPVVEPPADPVAEPSADPVVEPLAVDPVAEPQAADPAVEPPAELTIQAIRQAVVLGENILMTAPLQAFPTPLKTVFPFQEEKTKIKTANLLMLLVTTNFSSNLLLMILKTTA